tara:strand:+ start:982 stop:2319 length:1338 start_codon:yes stop_codon:yes gene_type:complete
MSILKSIVEKAELFSAQDTSRSVDIRAGIIGISYYEDILSPTITAKVHVVNASGAIKPFDDAGTYSQSIYNGLPLRGGEKLELKISGNSVSNPGLDFSLKAEDSLYVSSISDVMSETKREVFTLNLVSKEALMNETNRVKLRYTGNIRDSVNTILTNVLKTDKFNFSNFDEVKNSYDFIGNNKKPFWVITWLASKCISTIANESAGFVFFQTKDGFRFKSLDKLVKKKPKATYYYSEVSLAYDNEERKINNDRKILTYSVDRNQNLIEKLRMGAYSSERYYFNPLTFESVKIGYDENLYKETVKHLGSPELDLPVIEGLEKPLGQSPSRVISAVLDVGAKDAASEDVNNDQANYQSQKLMRYNTLFIQTLSITVSSNTNLRAGDVIECMFPRISDSKTVEFDTETSGLYMIKELCHYFDTKGSYTSMKLVRDTFGINKEARDDND